MGGPLTLNLCRRENEMHASDPKQKPKVFVTASPYLSHGSEAGSTHTVDDINPALP